MKKSMKIYVAIIAILTLIASCKDPREKTVWDYIGDDQTVSMERFEDGIEEMHKDLIKHGYMKNHDCRERECAKYHTNTNGDIERINSLMSEKTTSVNNERNKKEEYWTMEQLDNSILNETPNIKSNQNVDLSKQYSNKYFSIKYPSSWQVVQDDNQVTANTSISVQIMQIAENDYDFSPNINIIVSSKKWQESTEYLAQQSANSSKEALSTYNKIGISNTYIDNCKGSLLEYSLSISGYKLYGNQYIVKKSDNTTFTITATTDYNKHSMQMVEVEAILKSILIK